MCSSVAQLPSFCSPGKNDPELQILLFLFLKCWDCRCVPLCPVMWVWGLNPGLVPAGQALYQLSYACLLLLPVTNCLEWNCILHCCWRMLPIRHLQTPWDLGRERLFLTACRNQNGRTALTFPLAVQCLYGKHVVVAQSGVCFRPDDCGYPRYLGSGVQLLLLLFIT